MVLAVVLLFAFVLLGLQQLHILLFLVMREGRLAVQ
jgi:hypothetical protein